MIFHCWIDPFPLVPKLKKKTPRLGLVVEEINDRMIVVIRFRLGSNWPPSGTDFRIRFHRMLIDPVVGWIIFILTPIGLSSTEPSGAERTEMSAELFVHERREIFQTCWNAEILLIFRPFTIVRSVPKFRPFTTFGSFASVGSFGSAFRSRRLKLWPFTIVGSHANFVFLNRNWRPFFRRNGCGCLPVGTDDVAIISRECWGYNVSCYLSVQRRIQVSIALDVATASNRNLRIKQKE